MIFKEKHKWNLLPIAMLILGLALHLLAGGVQAATPAGTVISNQATAAFKSGGSSYLIGSIASIFTVQELLNLSVVKVDVANVSVSPGVTQRALTFQLQNTGNGSDSYSLTNAVVAGSDFTPANMNIYFDTNSSGLFDAGDTLYTPAVNDPVLVAGASLRIFVVSDIPAGVIEGQISEVRLLITSKAGTGPAGTKLAGQGDSGTDAMIGTSQGSAFDSSIYEVTAVLNLNKSAVISDPLGGSLPVTGAEITYTITVDVVGPGTLTNIQVTDAVPANTTYLNGSLELNGVPLSDAGDLDAGDFNSSIANGIAVQWTSLSGADGTQTVRFKVNID
jgi:uncharacterized repeat protein (TIGR01451 family)